MYIYNQTWLPVFSLSLDLNATQTLLISCWHQNWYGVIDVTEVQCNIKTIWKIVLSWPSRLISIS